jgi:hypothetical protein
MTVSRLRLLVDCQGKSTLQFIRHSAIIGEDVAIDFRQETTPHDIVTVLATLPPTSDEQWRAMSPRHSRDEPASLPAASLWRMHGRKWRLAEAGLFPGHTIEK